jgi:hypothetical protein
MKALKLARQNGNFTGERQFSSALAQHHATRLGCRLRPSESAFSDK